MGEAPAGVKKSGRPKQLILLIILVVLGYFGGRLAGL